MQLARLGQRLSKSGKLSVVYTYSPESAAAMKLLASLILRGRVPLTGVEAVPPDTDSIAEAVEDAWRRSQADSVLYIGGPPNPDRSCAINELSQMAQIMGSTLTQQEEQPDLDLQTDCDCRQWAFQFLRRPDFDYELPAETSSTTSTTTTTASTTTTTTTTTPTTTTSPYVFKSLLTSSTTEKQENILPKIKHPVRVRPINKPKFNDCSEPPEENGLWRIMAIIISAIGLAIVIVTFLAELISLHKAEKAPKSHEFFLPLGLLLLYASIAVMAPNAILTSSLCALRRILPGLGLVSAFVGLILQLIHELDKNVYIVNPERLKKFCGLSKSNALLALGFVLVAIQVILLVSWIGARPPKVLCTAAGYFECAALIRVEDHYPMVYGYPVFLGLIICGLSGISLKWKTNSGATWNLLALTVTFIAWAVTAVVETLSTNAGKND